MGAMSQVRGRLPIATDVWVKRRPPVDRDRGDAGTSWVLLVAYRAEGDEHAARLPLSSDAVAARVERLLPGARLGQRRSAQELFACLHQEWARGPLVGRHPAWDALFRFLAPLAAPAAVET
jgi:hypothetical protein